jgi:hypothetical protein
MNGMCVHVSSVQNKQRIPKDCPCHKFVCHFLILDPVIKNLLHCVIGSWINELRLDCCRWYFGKIKRIEAEKKLLLPENDHGAFLIRDSESRRNDYSLSGERAWYRRQNYFSWQSVNNTFPGLIVQSQHYGKQVLGRVCFLSVSELWTKDCVGWSSRNMPTCHGQIKARTEIFLWNIGPLWDYRSSHHLYHHLHHCLQGEP